MNETGPKTNTGGDIDKNERREFDPNRDFWVPEFVLDAEKNEKRGNTGEKNNGTEQAGKEIEATADQYKDILETIEIGVPMTEGEKKKYEFNKSADAKLGGFLEIRREALLLDKTKEIIMKDAGAFGLTPELAGKLTNAELKRYLRDNPEFQKEVMADSEVAEMGHLYEIYKRAKKKGGLDPSERVLFFVKLDSFSDDPQLTRSLRFELWNSINGENIDEKAQEVFGQSKEKKGWVQEMMKRSVEDTYRSQMMNGMNDKDIEFINTDAKNEIVWLEIEKINKERQERGEEKMTVDEEQLEREKIAEEKKKEINVLREKKMEEFIFFKIDYIKSVLNREISFEEIVFLNKSMGIDLTKISVSGSFFRNVKLGEGEQIGIDEFNKFLDKKLEGKVGYFVKMQEKFENDWSNGIEGVKDQIINGSLKEISTESVKRVYEKRKRAIMDERIARILKDSETTNEQERGEQEKKALEIIKAFGHLVGLINQFIGEIDKGDMDSNDILEKAESLLGEESVGRVIGEEGSEKRKKVEKRLRGGGPFSFLSLLLGFILIFPIIKLGEQYGGKKQGS